MNFLSESPTLVAIFGIIAAFMTVWAIIMARHPRRWRLWWMTFLGRADIGYSEERRREQEFRLSIAAYVGFSLLLGLTVISIYCVSLSMQGQSRVRSEYEQVRDKTMKDFEKMRSKKPFRKL